MNIKISGDNQNHLLALHEQMLKNYFRSSFRSQLAVFGVGAVSFFSGVSQAEHAASIWNGFTFSGALMCVLAIAGYSMSKTSRNKNQKEYQRTIEHKNQCGPWVLTITEDNILYQDTEITAEYKWSCFETYTEFPDAVIIYSYGAALHGVTVMRSFVTDTEYGQFKAFCKTRLKERNI